MTKEQIAFELVAILGATIRELKQVPSGELYAHVMDKLSLENYTKVIELLKKAKLVEESNAHLLTWIG